MKWKKVQTKLEAVKMLPGERRRDRVLSPAEVALCFTAARSPKMQKHADPALLRHTCLTRWAPHMDPWTLMRLAGHRDMATTMRCIHPADETTRRARLESDRL